MYKPEGPYTYRSGKRKGQCLELLMFTDYDFLNWQYNYIAKNSDPKREKNRLEKHLKWLLDRGEDRVPQMVCPQCGEKKVEKFAVRRSNGLISIGPGYTICDSETCKEKLNAQSFSKPLYYFKPQFANILRVSRFKGDRKRVAQLYKHHIFKLEARLTRQRAFEFFAK